MPTSTGHTQFAKRAPNQVGITRLLVRYEGEGTVLLCWDIVLICLVQDKCVNSATIADLGAIQECVCVCVCLFE